MGSVFMFNSRMWMVVFFTFLCVLMHLVLECMMSCVVVIVVFLVGLSWFLDRVFDSRIWCVWCVALVMVCLDGGSSGAGSSFRISSCSALVMVCSCCFRCV